METLEAIVLGIVQGLTEFLPISSSGHLRIVPAFAGWDDPGAAFTAVVQLGTMAAVLLYFRRDLWNMARALVAGARDPAARATTDFRLGVYIILGTIPISVIGLAFADTIEHEFRSLYLVAVMLIVAGLVLAWSERFRPARERRGIEGINRTDAIVVGLAQAAAVAEVRMAFARHSADPGLTASFTPEQLAAYNAGMASCETSVPDERDKQIAPPSQGELLRRYHAMLDSVAKAGDKYGDSYRACMTAAQVPAHNPDDLMDTVRSKFEGTTAPYAGHAAVGPWDAAVAFETKAVAADSSCRDGIYDEVIAQALPAVAKFKRDNASALVTLAAAR